MNHCHPVWPSSRRRFGPFNCRDGVVVIEGPEIWVHFLLPDLSQNPPGEAKMAVTADGGILFVKFLSDCWPLGVNFAVEADGLIRRTVNSFAGNPTNQIRELRRIRLIIALILIKLPVK